MGRAALPAGLLLALLLLPAGPALADRGAAEFFAGRGDAALREKAWGEAESQYRRAMEEDPAFLPARHGLAQALLGSGRTGPGVEELRAFVRAVLADGAAPEEWKNMAAKAEKQLADVDASGAELRKILDRYADDLVALARKWAAKDARTADLAARRALELRPGDKGAAEIVERLGGSVKGPPVALFNGTDLSDWEHARFPQWQVIEGVVIGEARDGAYFARTQAEFSGDFDVRAEIRVAEERGGTTLVALLGCWKGEYDYYGAGVINRKLDVSERLAEHEDREVIQRLPSEFRGTFDPSGWNTWVIRFTGNEVVVLVNGTELSREPRPEARKGGFVGIYVQNARAAFRRIEVQPR